MSYGLDTCKAAPRKGASFQFKGLLCLGKKSKKSKKKRQDACPPAPAPVQTEVSGMYL